jgi:hypothetical protein
MYVCISANADDGVDADLDADSVSPVVGDVTGATCVMYVMDVLCRCEITWVVFFTTAIGLFSTTTTTTTTTSTTPSTIFIIAIIAIVLTCACACTYTHILTLTLLCLLLIFHLVRIIIKSPLSLSRICYQHKHHSPRMFIG